MFRRQCVKIHAFQCVYLFLFPALWNLVSEREFMLVEIFLLAEQIKLVYKSEVALIAVAVEQ